MSQIYRFSHPLTQIRLLLSINNAGYAGTSNRLAIELSDKKDGTQSHTFEIADQPDALEHRFRRAGHRVSIRSSGSEFQLLINPTVLRRVLALFGFRSQRQWMRVMRSGSDFAFAGNGEFEVRSMGS